VQSDLSDDLAASVERTLREQARRNELVLAWVRTAGMSAAVVSSVRAYFHPEYVEAARVPLVLPAILASGWLSSLALALLLRRGFYHRWLRFVVPPLEAAVILSSFWVSIDARGAATFVSTGSTAVLALACAVFAVSGAFRLCPRAALVTATLAMAIFVMIIARLHLPPFLYAVGACLLGATGALGTAMAGQLVRMMRGEVGRVVLARFLPERVLDEAELDPVALVAQPRSVEATVVVTDLRGFTAWSEHRTPEQVLELLNRVHGALAEVVRAAGGAVDKFLGDGMLAVFGAVEPMTDHAARGLGAAREIQSVLAALDTGLRMGIGIHSGPLVIGVIGSGLRLEFTIVGDTVNVASRLESATKDLGVDLVASDDVVRRSGAEHGLRPLGTVPLRGRDEPLRVWG
jgi:adenylate cyclase